MSWEASVARSRSRVAQRVCAAVFRDHYALELHRRIRASPASSAAADRTPARNGGAIGLHAAVYRMVRLVAPRTHAGADHGRDRHRQGSGGRAIHRLSPRAGKPFVVINCAAIPEALLEAELFGYVRGAFTGAVQSRSGRIQSAHGGTLFLDEIGELPLGMQAKLLRFLDQGEVQRLGSSDVFRVDVRVIAATNADLAELARAQTIPRGSVLSAVGVSRRAACLAERRTDIETLARHFLRKFEPERAARASRLRRCGSWSSTAGRAMCASCST